MSGGNFNFQKAFSKKRTICNILRRGDLIQNPTTLMLQNRKQFRDRDINSQNPPLIRLWEGREGGSAICVVKKGLYSPEVLNKEIKNELRLLLERVVGLFL